MDWITLTEADLLLLMSGTEMEGMRSRCLQAQQEDPVAPSIALTVTSVRGAIAASPRNTLGADGTIPPSLKMAAAAIAVWTIMVRCGRVNDPSGARKDAADKANELLGQVANGKRTVETPTSAITVERNTPRGRYGSDPKICI